MVESYKSGSQRRNELAGMLITKVGLVSALFSMLSEKDQILL